MFQYRVDRSIKIGSNVWIGFNALILPGCIIEDYAVIAAGSVVCANVPRGAIAGGNPARVIKYRDFTNLDLLGEMPVCSIKKMGFLNTTIKEKNKTIFYPHMLYLSFEP